MKFTPKISKKVLSILLCLTLTLTYLPISVAAATSSDDHIDRVTDAPTMNDWQSLFMQPDNADVALTTEKAGRVWTDKSVFAADNIPGELTSATSLEGTHPGVTNTGDNFMVTLSAIASN